MSTKRLGTKVAAFTVLCFAAGYLTSKWVPAQDKPLPMLLVKSYSGTLGANYPETVYSSFPSKSLQALAIDVSNTNVQIKKSNSQNITVILEGKYFNVKPPRNMLTNQSTAGQLTLKTNELNTATQVNFEGQMIVMLPNNIKSVIFHSKQGNFVMPETPLNSLQISTISGNANIAGTINNLGFNTNSGNLNFNGSANQISIATLRGDTDLTLLNRSPEMKINSNSGDIKLNFVLQPDIAINFASINGAVITKDYNVVKKSMPVIIGNGKGKVTVNTISGDLWINDENKK